MGKNYTKYRIFSSLFALQNAGFAQGKLVRRGKIPKAIGGSFYHWKDFNVGIDVSFYSIVYHIVDTDIYTRVRMHVDQTFEKTSTY